MIDEKYLEEKSDSIERKKEAELAMLAAKKNMGLLKAIKEAFAQRKDMLIARAANFRAQMDTDLIIKQKYERELKK